MNRYEFCKTKDGSTGLYNNEVNDIYHSSYGALNESIQKFILPSNFVDFAKNNNNVSILDICYGIGYNSKAALYLAKSNNKNIKIKIDALEIDEELIFISPFVKDTIPSLDLKLFLINQINNNCLKFSQSITKFLNSVDDTSVDFYAPFISNFFKQYNFAPCELNQTPLDSTSLHNIYYHYISNSMKNGLKDNIFNDSIFMPYSEDARSALQKIKNEYDFIFLDAFTPQKDPTLWTVDFLKLIKSKMHKNSILVSYSNSTPFRSALLHLGFHVGKVLINGKQFGTTASLNKDKIKNPLDKFDIGLTQTTGGIMYRDINLNSTKDDIIANREFEKAKSNKISTTSYKKTITRNECKTNC